MTPPNRHSNGTRPEAGEPLNFTLGVTFFHDLLTGVRNMKAIIGGMTGKISEIMTTVLITVDMEDSVHRVEEVLNEHSLSSIPVIDHEKHDCFGIISLKDISIFHAAKKNPQDVRAWEVCSYKPLTADSESSVDEVGRLMVNNHIHHVVIADNGILKGFVSSLDIIGACLPQSSRQ